MEDIISQLAQESGPLGVIAACLVWLIINHQRKNTANERNDEINGLRAEIADLNKQLAENQTEKQLMQKDINFLLDEQQGTKQDIKEMKATLQTMALALERIAAKHD